MSQTKHKRKTTELTFSEITPIKSELVATPLNPKALRLQLSAGHIIIIPDNFNETTLQKLMGVLGC